MSRFTFSTLQANKGMNGNYSAGIDVPGMGVGIYVGSVGNVEIVTVGGSTVLYTAVPAGTFMQVPMFKSIGSNTTSTNLSVAYAAHPWK